MKKLLCLLLAAVMLLSLCACGEGEDSEKKLPETERKGGTPEEVVKRFMTAFFEKNVDEIVGEIPYCELDMIIRVSGHFCNDDSDKKKCVRDAIEAMYEGDNSKVTEMTIETKLYEGDQTELKADYWKEVNENYLEYGLADISFVQDVVFVQVTVDVKYDDDSNVKFSSPLACMKYDNNWYADFIYFLMTPIKSPDQPARPDER